MWNVNSIFRDIQSVILYEKVLAFDFQTENKSLKFIKENAAKNSLQLSISSWWKKVESVNKKEYYLKFYLSIKWV